MGEGVMENTVKQVKKMAILIIDPVVLCELFQLPAGAEVINIYAETNRRGILELKIEGAGWAVNEGDFIQKTTGLILKKFDGEGKEISRIVDWGLPIENDGEIDPGELSK